MFSVGGRQLCTLAFLQRRNGFQSDWSSYSWIWVPQVFQLYRRQRSLNQTQTGRIWCLLLSYLLKTLWLYRLSHFDIVMWEDREILEKFLGLSKFVVNYTFSWSKKTKQNKKNRQYVVTLFKWQSFMCIYKHLENNILPFLSLLSLLCVCAHNVCVGTCACVFHMDL